MSHPNRPAGPDKELVRRCRDYLQDLRRQSESDRTSTDAFLRSLNPEYQGATDASHFNVQATLLRPPRLSELGLHSPPGPVTEFDADYADTASFWDFPELGKIFEQALKPETQDSIDRLALNLAAALERATGESVWEVSLEFDLHEFNADDEQDPLTLSASILRLAKGQGKKSLNGFTLNAEIKTQISTAESKRASGLFRRDADLKDTQYHEASLRISRQVQASSALSATHDFRRDLETLLGAWLALGLVCLEKTGLEESGPPRLSPEGVWRFSGGSNRDPKSGIRRAGLERSMPFELGHVLDDALRYLEFHGSYGADAVTEARSRRNPELSMVADLLLRPTSILSAPDRRAGAKLCSALRFFLRAYLSRDPGELAMNAAMALETALLASRQRDPIVARLKPAVIQAAYLPGETPTPKDRRFLDSTVRRLYDARSRFIHEGQSDYQLREQKDALAVVGLVLRREIGRHQRKGPPAVRQHPSSD